LIYKTLQEAIESAKEFADAFEMEGCVKITRAVGGGYELFGTGELVKII
jgi:hypothetical protein